MSDLISRSALIEDANKHFGHPNAFYSNENLKKLIDNQPTIEAVPVVYGNIEYRNDIPHCSICGKVIEPNSGYCKWCGAKMKGGK